MRGFQRPPDVNQDEGRGSTSLEELFLVNLLLKVGIGLDGLGSLVCPSGPLGLSARSLKESNLPDLLHSELGSFQLGGGSGVWLVAIAKKVEGLSDPF